MQPLSCQHHHVFTVLVCSLAATISLLHCCGMILPSHLFCFTIQAEGVPGPTVWLAAAYWSLTIVSTIGFGDVLPYTNAERGVMLLAQLAGVLFFGIVLGSVTSLLQVLPACTPYSPPYLTARRNVMLFGLVACLFWTD